MAEIPRWTLEVGFAAYVVVVGVFVVLERRKPTATLALLLALIFVPLVGLASYLLFSRQRVRRRRALRSRRPVLPVEQTAALANLESLPEGLSAGQRRLVRLALATAAAPLRRTEKVTLLDTAPKALAAFQTAIESARRCVHCEFYIWRDDKSGRRITELLTERARAGVAVRVLIDHVGSLGLPTSHFAALRKAGGHVSISGKLRLPRLRRRLNFRNHRKIMTVDGCTGFLGGLNIGDEYLGEEDRWRDLHVELDGDAVIGLDAIFLDDWLKATGQIVDLAGQMRASPDDFDPRRPMPRDMPWNRARAVERRDQARRVNPFPDMPELPVRSEGPLAQIIPSGPDTEIVGVIGAQMTAAISAASSRAWVATPYFVPDEPLMLALRTAALAGVDVRLLVPNPHNNDTRIVAWAARSYYDEVLSAGGRIFEYRPGMLHAKYLIVDDVVCAIGSANMDVRSFHLNYEATAMFYAASVTHALAEIFEHDLGEADEVGIDSRAELPLPTRLAESTARVLSPLL